MNSLLDALPPHVKHALLHAAIQRPDVTWPEGQPHNTGYPTQSPWWRYWRYPSDQPKSPGNPYLSTPKLGVFLTRGKFGGFPAGATYGLPNASAEDMLGSGARGTYSGASV